MPDTLTMPHLLQQHSFQSIKLLNGAPVIGQRCEILCTDFNGDRYHLITSSVQGWHYGYPHMGQIRIRTKNSVYIGDCDM